MHEVLVNRLGGLSLPVKSVVKLTDRPDRTLDVYRGRKTTIQHSIQAVTSVDLAECFHFFLNLKAYLRVWTPLFIFTDFVVYKEIYLD